MDLLAADIATSPATEQFVARRNFDSYQSHSWASGTSPFADGNNQESVSEAVNAYAGLSLWAQAVGNTDLAAEADWMLSLEARSSATDWLEPDVSGFAGYGHRIVVLNWGGKRDYATWFSAEPAAKLGILLLPMLMTPIVVGVMWRALLNPDWGMVDWTIRAIGLTPPDWLGSVDMAMVTLVLVDSWQWTPFVFVIVFARLQALPQDVFEAASVDGAGAWRTFWNITLPMLMPSIIVALIFRTITALQTFDIPYTMTKGGPGNEYDRQSPYRKHVCINQVVGKRHEDASSAFDHQCATNRWQRQLCRMYLDPIQPRGFMRRTWCFKAIGFWQKCGVR